MNANLSNYLDIFGILSDKSSESSFFSQYYLQLYAQFENFMRRLCKNTQKVNNIILINLFPSFNLRYVSLCIPKKSG